MKTKNILFALLSNLFILPVFSQVGLEGIVVEKYYLSDAADSINEMPFSWLIVLPYP